jgi:hypothetical protein
MALPNDNVLALARDAMRAAEREVPRYSHARSPRTYTQHQLFALLAVRRFLRVDYRAMTTLASQWPELRAAIGLVRAPHYSTLCYAERRLLGEGGHSALFAEVLQRAHQAAGATTPVAEARIPATPVRSFPPGPIQVPAAAKVHAGAVATGVFAPSTPAREAPAARPPLSVVSGPVDRHGFPPVIPFRRQA